MPYSGNFTYRSGVEADLPPSGRWPRWPLYPPRWARTTAGAAVSAAIGAAVIAAITIGGTFGAQRHQPAAAHLNALGVALLTVSCLALLVRRRYPAATLLVVAAAVATYFALGYSWGPAWFPLIVATFAAILAGHRLLAWLTCGVTYLVIVWGGYVLPHEHRPAGAISGLTTAAFPLVILAGAEVVRAGQERAASARRARGELERRRASEERLRIAQELHDVLAHNISLISVQAGVALHLMDERPDEGAERARTALTAIRQASKEALGELRSVLGLLRASSGERPPLSPVPGMAQLSDLTSRATAAGLSVRTEITGDPRPLNAGTDLAAYRIVQEALTNVIRHADAATVTVRVSYGDATLGIDVEDDGDGAGAVAVGAATAHTGGVPAAGASASDVAGNRARAGTADAADPGGNGIAGMRERARLLGGELTAHPLVGKGFLVRAWLPLDGRGAQAGGTPATSGARPAWSTT